CRLKFTLPTSAYIGSADILRLSVGFTEAREVGGILAKTIFPYTTRSNLSGKTSGWRSRVKRASNKDRTLRPHYSPTPLVTILKIFLDRAGLFAVHSTLRIEA